MSQEETRENLSNNANEMDSSEENVNPENIENLPIGSIGSYAKIDELLVDEESENSAESSSKPEGNDSSLEALVNQEQSLARDRLRAELGREPTPEEVDKWLSEQTEGH